MKKRYLTLLLVLTLLFGAGPIPASADGVDQGAKVLMVFNPASTASGSFSIQYQSSPEINHQEGPEPALPYGPQTLPLSEEGTPIDAGGQLSFAHSQVLPHPEDPFYMGCGTLELEEDMLPEACFEDARLSADTAQAYQLGDLKTIYDSYRSNTVRMRCIALGNYCTVWTSVDDPEATRLPEEVAQRYAAAFDEKCPEMVRVFGDWLDVDGDGKLAVLCYDIGDNYAKQTNAACAGYFSYVNMISSDGRISNMSHTFQYSLSSARYYFGMDCVHVETSSLTPDDYTKEATVESRISTMLHEFQHVINQSWAVIHAKKVGDIVHMESLMNEGMSRAAQFWADPGFAASLVSNYNQSGSVSGLGMFPWNGGYDQYTVAFLLVEYMRACYVRKGFTEDDGNGVFRAIEQLRISNPSSGTNMFQEVAEKLFGQSCQSFARNLWQAVYEKAPSGEHGFNGEPWADALMPYVYPDPQTGNEGIGGGGARFYYLESGAGSVTGTQGLEYVVLDIRELASGQCGLGASDQISWSLSSAGHLRIEGTGKMANYNISSVVPPWYAYVNSISRATVGEGVTSLGNQSFIYAYNLRSVSLPSTLLTMGNHCFFCCYALESLEIPASVTTLPHQGFYRCRSLKSIVLPPAVEKVPKYAFQGCSALEEVTLPAGITEVEDYAFEGCEALKAVELPQGVTRIGDYAFQNCTSLETVSSMGLPAGENYVFPGDETLSGITAGSTQNLLGSRAFAGDAMLANVVLPPRITVLGEYAFYDCASLTQIYLPAKLWKISGYCFIRSGLRDAWFLGDGPSWIHVASLAARPFSDAVVLHYLEGRTAWTNDTHYNAGEGTWRGGYPLECWGWTDGERLITLERADGGPHAGEDGARLLCAAYDANNRMLTVTEDMTRLPKLAADPETAAVRLFVLDGTTLCPLRDAIAFPTVQKRGE